MFLIAQQWEGAGDARPGDKGKQGPWGPAHLGSVISALIGVNSTRPLPFATPNVGKCAVATLCSERGVPCRISALLQPKQRLTLLQLGPCRDCQMPFGDFRDLEKGRRTQCLAFLLLSTLCHPQATVDQCCIPAAGKSMTLPHLFYRAQGKPATNPFHQGTCSLLALAFRALVEGGALCQVQHRM